MDEINDTGRAEQATETTPPALLVIILDTNPYAWSTLSPYLQLNKAVADLLVFINAHLAFSHANKVAVIASHCGRATWLYPSPTAHNNPQAPDDRNGDGNADHNPADQPPANPNKYRPFALIEHELMRNLRKLLSTSSPVDLLNSPTSTMLAGALTLALSYINKTLITLTGSNNPASVSSNPDTIGMGSTTTTTASTTQTQSAQPSKMTSRILIVSTSGDLATQYIPVMNLIFAAQHSNIPIDILKLAGDTVLLQQASYTTSGIFLSPTSIPTNASEPPSPTSQISLLPTLLFAFLPDTTARQALIPPTGVNVDFRAACFCHRRVVSIGYVCSICLSIFCEEGVRLGIQQRQQHDSSSTSAAITTGPCLTCGTLLSLKVLNGGSNSTNDALLLDDHPRLKKKKKKRRDGLAAGDTAGDAPSTGANTPVPMT